MSAKLSDARNRDNDTEPYRERHLSPMLCLCRIARTTSHVERRQSKHAHTRWKVFHVKHAGPGGRSSRARSALNEGLLLACVGILVNDDGAAILVDDVVDALDVAAASHEVDNIGTQLGERRILESVGGLGEERGVRHAGRDVR